MDKNLFKKVKKAMDDTKSLSPAEVYCLLEDLLQEIDSLESSYEGMKEERDTLKWQELVND